MGDSRERERKYEMFLENLVQESEVALQEGWEHIRGKQKPP